MLIVLKFLSTETSLFDGGTLRDKLKIQYLTEEAFPYFNVAAEADDGGVMRRTVGEFAIELSLIGQPVTSARGFSLKDFFRDTQDDLKYVILGNVRGFEVAGMFRPEDITCDFTYIQNKMHLTFMVRTLEEELKTYLTSLDAYLPVMETTNRMTFEAYIAYHLQGLRLSLPAQTLATHCGADIAFNAGAYRSAGTFTKWSKISRWQTFVDLYKGLGFQWYLKLAGDVNAIYEAENILLRNYIEIKIFWFSDIENLPAINSQQVLSHREEIQPRKTKRFIVLRAFEAVYQFPDYIQSTLLQITSDSLTGVRGAVLKSNGIIHADSFDVRETGGYAVRFPFLMYSAGNFIVKPDKIPENEYVLHIASYNGMQVSTNPFNFTNDAFLREQVFEISENGYSCPANTIAGRTHKAGVIHYWRFFMQPDGTNRALAAFVLSNYRRYLSTGYKKKKIIKVLLWHGGFAGQTLEIYRHVRINDGGGEKGYYISKIAAYEPSRETAELEVIEL